MQPMQGIRVLEFGDGVAVAMTGLILAEAGAEVIKVESPRSGAAARAGEPRLGAVALDFALLNAGKKSVAVDLDADGAAARLRPLLASADVLIDGLRPGTMGERGLDYDAVAAVNDRLLYCSLSGWGQDGPLALEAGRDLNYLGATGLLRLGADETGAPVLPPAEIADIAAGAYPAVINILLALMARAQSGKGARLDLAICDGLFALAYWAIGRAELTGRWPVPGGETLTGGSPRYQLYATADGRFVAVAALEPDHWDNLCERLELDEELRDDQRDPEATRQALAAIIAARTARYWHDKFENRDLCCSVVETLEQALANPQFRDRGLFERKLRAGGQAITAVVVPVAASTRESDRVRAAPALGADNALLDQA